jgi:tetratricopeptide (TPR) repeat protein
LAEAHARSAIAAYEAAGDQRAVGRATALLGNILIDRGDLAGAAAELEAGLQRMRPAGVDREIESLLLTTLSRAFFRSGAQSRALETADRALAVAEILGLEEVVAEALINKGGTLEHLGRWREAEAVLEAAARLAERGGWIASELRARIDLVYPALYEDPRRALALARVARDLAQRVGIRAFGLWLAHLGGELAFLTGQEWENAVESLSEATATSSSPGERGRLVAQLAMFRAARGEPIEPLLDELETLEAGVTDPQVRGDLAYGRSEIALIRGDLPAAHRLGISSAGDFVNVMTSLGLQAAARASAWDGDVNRARATAERLEALATTGVMLRAHRTLAAAYVAALEGRREDALQGFREVLNVFAGAGLDFEVARTGLDMVLLLGVAQPEARAAVEESRTIFERVGGQAYIDKLEGALAVVHPPGSAAAADSGDEAASRRQGATIT